MMEKRAPVGSQETLDPQVHKGHWDPKEPRARQELWDSLVPKEPKEIPELSDHLV